MTFAISIRHILYSCEVVNYRFMRKRLVDSRFFNLFHSWLFVHTFQRMISQSILSITHLVDRHIGICISVKNKTVRSNLPLSIFYHFAVGIAGFIFHIKSAGIV